MSLIAHVALLVLSTWLASVRVGGGGIVTETLRARAVVTVRIRHDLLTVLRVTYLVYRGTVRA